MNAKFKISTRSGRGSIHGRVFSPRWLVGVGLMLAVLGAAHAQPAPSAAQVPIRIKAGIKKPLVDADGRTWLPDRGFVGGVIADHDVITPVANTNSPALYQSERYNMTAFACPVPNGRYLVRLHFAEMYDRISGPGQRVFSFEVEGHEVKNFDIWTAAGGARRAHIEEFKIEITDAKLDITFTKKEQYPVIQAIEILPAELLESSRIIEAQNAPVRVERTPALAATASRREAL